LQFLIKKMIFFHLNIFSSIFCHQNSGSYPDPDSLEMMGSTTMVRTRIHETYRLQYQKIGRYR
jgi:hypothetical protein